MWMSELSSRSGLPVPTIKYYLREELLHPGEAVGATRARYDDSHVRRLRLVRALTEVAGMRLEDVRRVLVAIDDPTLSLHEAIGSAHTRLAPSADGDFGDAEEWQRVEALLQRHRLGARRDTAPIATGAGRRPVIAGRDWASHRATRCWTPTPRQWTADLRAGGRPRSTRDRPRRSSRARRREHPAARAGAAHAATDRPGKRRRAAARADPGRRWRRRTVSAEPPTERP